MTRQILIVVTGAAWMLGAWFLVGRLGLALLLFALPKGNRWQPIGGLLRRYVYASIGLLVASGLAAHLIVGATLPFAPELMHPPVFWIVPAAAATCGALLLWLAGRYEAGGLTTDARALCFRGGLLGAGGALPCAAIAAIEGRWPLAGLAGLSGAIALLTAGSRKPRPSGRFAALAWLATAICAAAL